MKIYISGKISGLPPVKVRAKFQAAQDFLENLGFETVNPLKNGLTESNSWEQHIARDVELLLPCDAIYMFDGWQDSVGAGIEYDIALRTGKDIWFESHIMKSQNAVLEIQNAIYEATGMKFHEYAIKSRERERFFARMIFAHHCRRYLMKLTDIGRYIHRDHTSVIYLLKKYGDEIKYNPAFRDLAQKVESILNNFTN